MSLIVAARFQTFEQAESAARNLYATGFRDEDMHTFYVNTAGEHARYPLGGDRKADPDSRGASVGALVGAASLGILFALVCAVIAWQINPSAVAVTAAGGVGAYIGALAGALWVTGQGRRLSRGTWTEDIHPEVRQAGVLLALHIQPDQEARAVAILREAGGMDVERANGRWANGNWQDFDPLTPPQREPEPATHS
ncbi:hypothetical protein [Bordetella petrii]|uniref:hypothetical protein n=1 Tax=Bordetella petrii TaxID=94624 RepID=UPI001A97695E|nr:hypothetical protein [Bordetella petrii]MBO1113777.1 hypothetical protein [Bordetella petrii]